MDDTPVSRRQGHHIKSAAELEARCAELEAKLAERDEKVARQESTLAQQQTRIAEQTSAITDHLSKIAWLQHEVQRLRKYLYGRRADRLTSMAEIGQLLLEFSAQLEAQAVNPSDVVETDQTDAPPSSQTRRVGASAKQKRGRRSVAELDHLPTHVVDHDLQESEKCCPCCGENRACIGHEVSWQIEYVPGHFERWCHRRMTYACAACDKQGEGGQVETARRAPGTQSPVEKGLAGPGLMAFIVTSKYADYLPLYRLENIFARNGLEIARSTQSVWCGDVADIVEPLYALMCDRVCRSSVVATDDTTMPMQAPGRTTAARMWVYCGDESNPYNVFDFTPSRARDGPLSFLRSFRGTLLADGYGGYDGVVAGNGLTRAGCWAHARRKFVDAEKSEPVIAREAVTRIDAMFAVEREVKNAPKEVISAARTERSRPLFDALYERLVQWQSTLLPKHPMAASVRYALNQIEPLKVFLSDPAVPMDNNFAEREMKRQALNRKNSLFVANPRGGRTAAILSSITSSCRRHEIDPQVYFTQLLVNLRATPAADLPQWLPDEWKRRVQTPR